MTIDQTNQIKSNLQEVYKGKASVLLMSILSTVQC